MKYDARAFMELREDVYVKCDHCKTEIRIDYAAFSYQTFSSERSMGVQIDHIYVAEIGCPHCDNDINCRIIGYEYPSGAFDYQRNEASGATFLDKPELQLTYDEYEFSPIEKQEFSRVQILLKRISNNPVYIHDISSREFEEVVEEIFRENGYETILTQATRDGGKDIIATKRELTGPVTLNIECKHYRGQNNVSVGVVQRVLGVMSSDQVNKTVIVTTSHFSRDAKKYAGERHTLVDLVDIDDLMKMIYNTPTGRFSPYS